jgi:hypothetical protein
LADDGSVRHESELSANQNRPGNQKPRLWLYSVIDDHSRASYLRAYPAHNCDNVLDFLARTWSVKDAKFPMHGLPQRLLPAAGARPPHGPLGQPQGGAATYGTTPPTASNGRWSVLRANPFAPEFVYLALDDQNDVNAQRWDGSAWSLLGELETASSVQYNSIDLAFRADTNFP